MKMRVSILKKQKDMMRNMTNIRVRNQHQQQKKIMMTWTVDVRDGLKIFQLIVWWMANSKLVNGMKRLRKRKQ